MRVYQVADLHFCFCICIKVGIHMMQLSKHTIEGFKTLQYLEFIYA